MESNINNSDMNQSENKGIFYEALSEEIRERFIRHRDTRDNHYDGIFEEMASYIRSDECTKDLYKLIDGNYEMLTPPYHFRIPKNFSGRKRDIYTWYGNTRYLVKLIAYCLRKYDYKYPDGLYSFRTKLTARDFLLKLRNFEGIENYYIVKADVSNYVGSIVPEQIIPMLEELWSDDPAFLNLLKHILLQKKVIERDGSIVDAEPGGLGGIPLANHFMNIYLTELDRHFYPIAPLYCRYSDDIIIFARTKEEAEEYIEYFNSVLEKRKLHTNNEKTYLIQPGESVEILGCRMKDGNMDISDHAKNKLKRKIRMHANRLIKRKKRQGISDEEAGKMMIDYCHNIFFGINKKNELTWSRWIFPVITETTSLKELDNYIQNAIRYVIAGSFADKKYRTTYEDLKKLGYRSLVHSYYHFEH